jgi:hypothetical protein
MNEALDAQAENLRGALLYVAGTICLAGYIIRMRDRQDFLMRFYHMTTLALVVAAIAFFEKLVDGCLSAFIQMTEAVQQENDLALNRLWYQDIPESDFWSVVENLQYFTAVTLQKLGGGGRWVLGEIQKFVCTILIAVSPLPLSMAMIPQTQGTAVRFALTTFGVVLWSVGYVLVDMLLVGFLEPIAAICGVSGVISGIATGGTLLAASLTGLCVFFVILVVLMNVLYLAVPFGIAALLSGANPIVGIASAGVSAAAGAIAPARGASALAVGGALTAGEKVASVLGSRTDTREESDASPAGHRLAQGRAFQGATPVSSPGALNLPASSGDGESSGGGASASGPRALPAPVQQPGETGFTFAPEQPPGAPATSLPGHGSTKVDLTGAGGASSRSGMAGSVGNAPVAGSAVGQAGGRPQAPAIRPDEDTSYLDNDDTAPIPFNNGSRKNHRS